MVAIQSVAVLYLLVPFYSLCCWMCLSQKRLWDWALNGHKAMLLMGRNLEETSGRMISNRNPHSRHTSAGPWDDLSICGETRTSSAVYEAVLSFFYPRSSSLCSIIHGFCKALIRHQYLGPHYKSDHFVCLYKSNCIKLNLYCFAFAGPSEVMKLLWNSVFIALGQNPTVCVNI